MTDDRLGRIEQLLAQRLRAYLAAAARGEAVEQRLERDLGEELSWLLQERLSQTEARRDFPWMDGVLVDRVTVLAPTSLEVRGWAIEGSTQTCEPFLAQVHLSGDGAQLHGYMLALGDAEKGPQRLPIGSRHKHLRERSSEDWLCVITRDVEPAGTD